MKFAITVLAVGLSVAAGSVLAAFQELPTAGPSLRLFGAQNPTVDQFFIPTGDVESTTNGINTYRAPSSFNLLASLLTSVQLPVSVGGPLEEIGTFYDYVFQDTSDNKLVFGSRLVLTDEDAEINDIFRNGFDGYSAAVAWTFRTDLDLRVFSSARTAVGLLEGADAFDANVVDLRSDINFSEGNPQTGWYFIKTDAPTFAFAADIVRLRQGGEEGQPVVQAIIGGFTPSAVPEPSTYAMLLAGLGLLVLLARRGDSRSKPNGGACY